MDILQEGASLQDGKYKIQKVLGKGGFGVTYLAVQDILDRQVAIKEFCYNAAPDVTERFLQKFIKEAKTISKLQHSGIIQIYDIFKENGTAYYVMEYIEGVSLAEMVKKNGPLPENKAVDYISAAADALAFIHDRNITHLDIKPGNIMVRKRDDKVVLIDFGVAKQYNEETNEGTTTTPVGISHGYSPIEQYRKNGVNTFSPQSDVYALAATLYKLLTGQTPAEAIEVMENGVDVEPLKKQDVSFGVIEAIVNAMKSRNQRTQSVRTFATAIAVDHDDETVIVSAEQNSNIEEEDDETEIVSAKKSSEIEKKIAAAEIKKATTDQPADKPSAPSGKEKSVKIAAIAIALVAIAALAFVLIPGNKSKEDSAENENVAAVEEMSETLADTLADKVVAESLPIAEVAKPAETAKSAEVTSVADTKEKEPSEAQSEPAKEAPVQVSGKSQTFTANGVAFTMKQVAKGTFFMGATDEQTAADEDESPSHQVTLRMYYLAETEVTQELWQAVMGTNPSAVKGTNLPVESVSWSDCLSFISKLDAATGQKFRLPTEAEWEYAARGARNSNNAYSGSSSASQVGWYSANSGGKTHAVKGKTANELGLYDMSGNVAEWCSDWYGKYRISHEMNPRGASSGQYRVVRGGSVTGDADECRTSCRLGVDPTTVSPTLGLRLAL